MRVKSQAQLITNRSNIAYLSNFTGSAGFILFTKNKYYLFTDFRYIERAKNTIKRGITIINTTKVWQNPKQLKESWQKILEKHHINTLGIDESDLTLAKFKKFKKISPKIRFYDSSGEIEALREIKTRNEIRLIKKSQDINGKTFSLIKKIIQSYLHNPKGKKLLESDIAWKIKEIGHELGSEEVSFDPIVGFGKNSAIVHHNPGKTTLKKGDIILIDMGMKYLGYCSDMTRMLFTGKPTEKQVQIYNLVLKAQNFAIEHIKTGISGKKADSFSRQIIEKAGFGEAYGHAGGHGIGLDIHETPSLAENYTEKLKKNSIITVEPGIYLPGEFGVRIEDMLLVTKSGNKKLSKVPKNLNSAII